MAQCSPKSWLLYCSSGVLLGLALQFWIFRLPAVYELCLKTHLYNHVWWVDRPAKHLILGSSNAMNGVIPNLISKITGEPEDAVLNLGLNGATPFVMLRNLELYIQKYPFPQRLDVVITPVMLQERYLVRTEGEKIWLNWKQWQRLEAEGEDNSYAFPAMLFWQALKFDKMELFRQYHFDLKETRQRRGFQPNYEHDYTYTSNEWDFPRLDADFAWSREQLRCLKKIKTLAEQHHCQLYYLLTPLHPRLYEVYRERSHDLQGLENLIRENLGPMRILGSLCPQVFDLEHRHFINRDHLTLEGARRYTEKTYGNIAEQRGLQPRVLGELVNVGLP